MSRIEKLIHDIRQESRLAQCFGVGAFLLTAVAGIIERLQGHPTSPSGQAAGMFLMALGFLGCAHSRLALRIAQAAETLADTPVRPIT